MELLSVANMTDSDNSWKLILLLIKDSLQEGVMTPGFSSNGKDSILKWL